MNLKYLIAEFIPIILLFLLMSQFKNVAKYSHTVLGKLISILIIIFYTYLDKIVGLFVCGIVILYYQCFNKTVENMLNIDIDDINSIVDFDLPDSIEIDDGLYLTSNKNIKKEVMTDYNELYGKDTKFEKKCDEDVIDDFRKKSCDKGFLKYKNMKIKTEMAEHVFPELKFTNATCNPCEKMCDFSLIGSRLKTEDMLSVRAKPHPVDKLI